MTPYALPHPEAEDYISDPASQLGALTRWLERSADPNRPRLSFGVDSLDAAVTITDQDLVVIAGRPSMGKSQLVKWLARNELRRVVEKGRSDECVVFVTLEEPEEKVAVHIHGLNIDVESVRLGAFDIDAGKVEIIRVLDSPLFIVRHPGVVGVGVNRRIADPISAETVMHTVERIAATTREGKRPTLICLDYLQLLRPSHNSQHEKTRVAEIIAATEGAKIMSLAFKCPVVMAVQSGRETDNRKPPLPEMGDMAWGSVIEQAADTVVGVLRPVRHEDFDVDPGTGLRPKLPFNGTFFEVDDDLFMMRVVKQKDGRGRSTHVAKLDVRRCELSDHPSLPKLTVPR